MNILLLNNNPVVNKLVTLSAQKTSDSLDVAANIEELNARNYDLLVVDDSLYSEDLFEQLSSKINYSKSLYICPRDAEVIESFDSILKKPLPVPLITTARTSELEETFFKTE